MENPTNRELYILLEDLDDKNEIAHKTLLEKLELLVAQTTRINGSVKDLLLWRANVQGKTWILPIVISALVAGAISLLFK